MRRILFVRVLDFHDAAARILFGPSRCADRHAPVSQRLGEIVHRYAPWVEFLPGRPDELLADLGPGDPDDGLAMARRLERELAGELLMQARITLARGGDRCRVAEWRPAPAETAAGLVGIEDTAESVLERLALRAAEGLVRAGARGRTVSVTVHAGGGRRFACRHLEAASHLPGSILGGARGVLAELQVRVRRPVRVVELAVSGLESAALREGSGAARPGADRPLPLLAPRPGTEPPRRPHAGS